MDHVPPELPNGTLPAGELLRLSLEAVPAGIAMFDTNMCYIASSHYYRNALGVAGLKLEGRCHYDVFPDLPGAWKEVDRRVLAGETLSAEADPFVRADGGISYWQWKMRPWHHPDGRIGGAVLCNRDITTSVEKQAQMQRMSDALDAAQFGICIVEAASGTVSYANAAFAQLHGYSPGEIAGLPVLHLDRPEDRAHMRAHFTDADARGHTVFEAQRVRRDGSMFPGLVSITAIKPGPGGQAYRIGTVLDISESQTNRAALRAKDVLFRTYIEDAPVAVTVADATGALIAANPAAEAMMRSKPGALLGLTVADMHFPENHAAVLDDLATLMKDGHLLREYRMRRMDGTGFAAILSARRMADGTSLGFLQDIDKLRQAEAAHMAVAHDLEALVAMGPAVVLYRARVTASGATVLSQHGDTIRLTGSGLSTADLLRHAETAEMLGSVLVCDDRQEAVCDITVQDDDGACRWVRNRIRVICRRGSHADIVGYLSDVTRDKLEQQRLQRVATLVTLGEMATGMAHELNQPLASISFAGQNAGLQLQRPTPDLAIVTAKLDKVVAEARRASLLLEHMKIFGRNERKPVEPVAWKAALKGALDILSPRLRYFAVRDEIPDAMPAVMGAPVLMEQVLINLIGNAMDAYDATDPGGGPGARVITVAAEALGSSVALRVSDHAGGIPVSAMARLFEPFFTTKPTGKGTGLGLALCFGTITEMGGTVAAHNEGGGAVFDIRVPAAPV